MPRETKQQKEERLQQQEAERQLKHKAYLDSVPKRLMDAHALAQDLMIDTRVTLTATGPAVYISIDGYDQTLTYQTEQWELERVEEFLDGKKTLRDFRHQQYLIAKEAFSKLSDEVKAAIKQHIHSIY
jgi:hypothetical protein